jgi:hypothetical protein
MELIGKYKADDGVEFTSERECLAHEARPPAERILGVTPERLARAYSGEDGKLGAAIEVVAREIREARLARGESKRKAKA